MYGLLGLEPTDLTEEEESKGRNKYCACYDEDKGVGRFVEIYINIHSVEARDHRRDGQYDRETSHTFHDGIDVVRDDAP